MHNSGIQNKICLPRDKSAYLLEMGTIKVKFTQINSLTDKICNPPNDVVLPLTLHIM